MLVDLREIEGKQEFSADVCIVGAGAAGVTLASQLSGSSVSVCLVESGGLEADGQTQLLSEVENVGIPRLPAISRRLRLFGGTTTHWTGKCGRLDPMDMAVRDWVPDSGWPIDRAELDPYYDRAQEVLDLAPDRNGLALANRFGVPIPSIDDKIAHLHAWQMSAPTRFGTKYRWVANSAPNIKTILYANATNVQVNPAETYVEHVDVKSLNGKSARIIAQIFVLACGGIENARLLLASNGVNPRGVGNPHDIVGRYFMEHLRARLLISVDKDPYVIQRTYNTYSDGGREYWLGMSLSETFQRNERILNGAFMANYDSAEVPVTETASLLGRGLLRGDLPDEPTEAALRVLRNLDEVIINLRRKAYRPGSRNFTRDAAVFVVETEQSPHRESCIGLSSELDGLGQRRALVDWRLSELDRQSMLRAIQAFSAQLWLCHRARVLLPTSMSSPLASWGNNFLDVSHHMGTTRMSSDPTRGVVDTDCRVHGIENLYVAGSSVFPTCGHVNPTMTIVALAIRLAKTVNSLISR